MQGVGTSGVLCQCAAGCRHVRWRCSLSGCRVAMFPVGVTGAVGDVSVLGDNVLDLTVVGVNV